MKNRPVEGLFQHPQAITLIDLQNGVLSVIAMLRQFGNHPNVPWSLSDTRSSISTMTPKPLRTLLVISLGLAILTFATPWGVKAASTELTVRASAVLAASWFAVVVYAFIKFGKRGLWFLLGTPLIGFWFFELFLIAWGCAHTLRACR
jgi:hypothetical protein